MSAATAIDVEADTTGGGRVQAQYDRGPATSRATTTRNNYGFHDAIQRLMPQGRKDLRGKLAQVGRVASALGRPGLRHTAARTVRSVRRHGVSGTVRRVRGLGRPYVWLRLSLPEGLQVRPLDEGLDLRRCDGGELSRYAQIAQDQNIVAAPEWLADGGQLWLVTEGERTAFACWIFPARMQMGEARGGWLRLPEGAVCLEHTLTSPDFRGRGIAPAAWSAIASGLASQGVRTVMTKVRVDNAAVKKALGKIGFVPAEPDEPIMRDFAAQLGH